MVTNKESLKKDILDSNSLKAEIDVREVNSLALNQS